MIFNIYTYILILITINQTLCCTICVIGSARLVQLITYIIKLVTLPMNF